MQIQTNFEFLNQSKIISGNCALNNIPFELSGYDARKPLVIASRKVTERGLKKVFIKTFYDSVTVLGAFFDEVDDYAGISLAQKAATLYRERGCDSIIALGNGATVDLAKAVNVLVTRKIDTLQPYLEGAPIPGHLKPLVYVPVGSFSGMEATGIMTIDNHRITSNYLYPDVIILDPRMTRGRCTECAAKSAVIAIEQAVMAVSGEDNNPMTDAYAYSAMQYIVENVKKQVKRPKNTNASLAMANASVMAAVAFSNSKPSMARLLADELSKSTGISAAIFIAILLPRVMAYMAHKKNAFRDELLLAAAGMEVYSATPKNEREKKGVEAVMGVLGKMKGILPDMMEPLKVQKHLLAKVAGTAAAKSEKRFSDADCLAVLELAWK
jgi:alcohol dehydrogenase